MLIFADFKKMFEWETMNAKKKRNSKPYQNFNYTTSRHK